MTANLLLVESENDLHVFKNLLRYYDITALSFEQRKGQTPSHFVIKKKDGVTDILHTLPVELKGSDLERLGIVIDADTAEEFAKRWKDLQKTLSAVGYKMPDTPSPEGTIIRRDTSSVVVGVWVMPDNKTPGMLEDFVSLLVPAGDILWEKAEDCLQQIPERRFETRHHCKARVHTWLAWQKEPGKPMGWAITLGYLDASVPHTQPFVHWIRRLFDLP